MIGKTSSGKIRLLSSLIDTYGLECDDTRLVGDIGWSKPSSPGINLGDICNRETSVGDTNSGSATSSEVEELRMSVLDPMTSILVPNSGRSAFGSARD